LLRFTRKTATTFKPISRFGIGLLSCFIVADELELSTRNAAATDGPLRLSITGLKKFFVLQKRPNPFRPMPGPAGDEDGERKFAGTSISVRLDPKAEQTGFNLRAELQRQLFCPPVPVLLDGRAIGFDPKQTLEEPWCERRTIRVSARHMASIGKALQHKFITELEIDLFPIDVTQHSGTPDLRGQMILARLRQSDDLTNALRSTTGEVKAKAIRIRKSL